MDNYNTNEYNTNNPNNGFNNPNMNDYNYRSEKKTTAGILGILLGPWGVHKFYLGYTTEGLIQIAITLVTCGMGGIVGFIEGIIYLTKSDREFDETYVFNKKGWF